MAAPIRRIEIRLKLGKDRMAGTDDPVYLGLRGGAGREFRLLLAKGRSLRRGAEDHYVLGRPDDPDTNIEHPDWNDPTAPPLDADDVASVYLRKGFEPIPNVRAFGELDDRIEIEEATVEFEVEGRSEPIRFARSGPIWLGLGAGIFFEIPRVEG